MLLTITVIVHDKTPLPIREIVELFAEACPHRSYRFTDEFGHMAPVTHTDVVNLMVCEFLDSDTAFRAEVQGAS